MDTHPRRTLSAVVMTKNVERIIEPCLQSITWADEIVIVDGYSTDRTIDICKRYAHKIIQNKWDGFRFCTERNLGSEHASCDWILQIDPDERSTEGFKNAVLEILKNKSNPYVAYEYWKKNYFLGHFMRHGGWYHCTKHLFKRGMAEYEGIIHENLHVNGKVGRIEAAIEHHPFESISQFILRHNGYSDREAYQILEKHGVLSDKKIRYQIAIKPFKRFYKFFIRKKGYKEGWVGFIFCVLYAWVHFVNWVKYWDLVQLKKCKPS